MNTYLIPANSKKSILKFGMFNNVDLIILGVGIGIFFLMMMFTPVKDFGFAVLALMPAFIAVFLVFPVPNYHNVRTVIKNAINFYTTRQKYVWKGWCFKDESSKE